RTRFGFPPRMLSRRARDAARARRILCRPDRARSPRPCLALDRLERASLAARGDPERADLDSRTAGIRVALGGLRHPARTVEHVALLHEPRHPDQPVEVPPRAGGGGWARGGPGVLPTYGGASSRPTPPPPRPPRAAF